MPEFKLTLHIDRVGDLEALNALNALDAKGRRIIEGVSGATGRAMGEVALAYERGSKSARLSLEAIAKEHEKNIAAMVREERAADALGRRQGLATLSATRGVEQLVRSGTLLSSSLDQTISQVSQLAFGFGATGPIIGAIGVATVAMVNLFRKAHEETQKLAREMAEEINRISHEDLTSQALTAQRLYSGDQASTNWLEQRGIPELQSMLPGLRARVKAGTTTRIDFKGGHETTLNADARSAAEDLQKVEDRLKEIKPIYDSIMGVGGLGGTLARAAQRQAALDLPEFVTNQIKQTKKAADEAAKTAAEEFGRGMKARAAAMKEAVKDAVATIVENGEIRASIVSGLVPTKEQINKAVKEASDNVKEALANSAIMTGHAPLSHQQQLAQGKNLEQIRDMLGLGAIDLKTAMDEINEQISEFFTVTLRSSIINGFEVAFSGQGLKGFIDGFFSTMLGAIGGYLEQLGATFIVVGLALDALSKALATLDGPAAVAAGVALIAAGAGLKAVAGSFGKSHGGSSSGGGYGGSTGLAQIYDRGIINPDSYSQRKGSDISARSNVTVNATIIGKDDPNAQRQIAEIVSKAAQRGWIGKAAA